MSLRKYKLQAGEVSIFDEAIVYKRGAYWQFRMWLLKEHKYARKSLKTRSRETAIERGKQMYLELYANQQQGKTYFSITTRKGVELYVEHRRKHVETGIIVAGRLGTIQTHLQHWLNFIGRDTKLKELDRTDCEEYFRHRFKSTAGKVKQVTVLNEQSTINACIKWLFRQGETHFDAFDFPPLPKVDYKSDAVRRATLSTDEWMRLCVRMRGYCAKKHCPDATERLTRQLVRHFVLVAGNSGLRTGEQRQLRWSDVEIEPHTVNGTTVQLAHIQVRAETSKVRLSRRFMCRGGEYFVRLRRLFPPVSADSLVFSTDGTAPLSKAALLYHFNRMLATAEIENYKLRGIVPYSLRHFMITQRAMSGVSFSRIADMCGTSTTQIERTYYHLNDDIRRSSALADFRIEADGTIRTTTLLERFEKSRSAKTA